MKKLLLASSFYRSIQIIVQVGASLLITPYLIRVLGDQDYGLWILILSLLGWFSVLDIGFSSAISRQINIALAEQKEERINTIFSCAIILFVVLGLAASFGVILLSYFSYKLPMFGIDSESQTILSISLLLLSLKAFWDLVMGAFHGFFAAFLRYDIDANITSVGTIIKYSLVAYLILEFQVYGAVIATLASDLFINVLKISYANKIYKPLKFSRQAFNLEEIKSLFAFSKHVGAIGIANRLNTNVDPILVTRLFDLGSLASFAIGSRLCAHVDSLVMAITDIFGPVFTKLHARKKEMQDLFQDVSEINIFVSTSLLLPLYILNENFIWLWIGEGYEEASAIVKVLVLAYLCRAVARPVWSVLFAQANHHLLSLVNLAGAVLNVVLSIAFGKIYGLIGVAYGTLAGFFMSDVIFSLLLLRRYNNYKIMPVVVRFLLSFLIIFVIGSFTIQMLSGIENSWVSLLFKGFCIGAISLPVTVPCLLGKRLRNNLAASVKDHILRQ